MQWHGEACALLIINHFIAAPPENNADHIDC